MIKRLLATWSRFLSWLRGDMPALDKPEIRYVDADGVGWTATPDYHESWHPDEGQHETWKREMRIWLWHAQHPSARSVDLRDLGLSRTPRVQPLPLSPLPMGSDLAASCRRLGFARLALAAGARDMGWTFDAIKDLHEHHEDAVFVEARRRFEVNTARAKTWDVPARGPFIFDSAVDTVALLSCGEFGGPLIPQGRTLAPLEPLRVSADADASAFTRARR